MRGIREKGFTLMELMMVVTIIAIVMMVASFEFTQMAPSFRLRGAAEQVAARLQLLKMRAVATNKRSWFVPITGMNAYTGFIDTSSYGTVQGSEFPRTEFDMSNTLTIPSGSIPGAGNTCPGFYLPTGITYGVPTPTPAVGPEGLTLTATTKVIINGAASAAVDFIGFKESGLGLVNFLGTNSFPTNPSAIFLTNTRNEGYAVVIGPTGRVRYYKWNGTTWN